MTKKDDEGNYPDPHTASLFFPLPNGTALLYNLKGTATEPESETTITETVVAKQAKYILIPVQNWLK